LQGAANLQGANAASNSRLPALRSLLYAGFLVLTWFFQDLPLLIAWYGSFQHETIHGRHAREAWIA
jgi:hypothetical protein